MADAKKKTFEDFVGVPRHGPDPVDDAKVTEFTQRSQDPRAAPWEALRRGGAQLDSALGTGPGSQRSALDQGVQNLGRYLNQPVPGQPWPGPEVGPTRDVGHFESLAQKIPGTLTSPTFQAMAFPTGEESLARMRDEAVFRDQMEAKGARAVEPPSSQAMREIRDNQLGNRESEVAQGRTISTSLGNHIDQGGADPLSDPSRETDFGASRGRVVGGYEVDPHEGVSGGEYWRGNYYEPEYPEVPPPADHPERPTLEAFLSKLYGRR